MDLLSYEFLYSVIFWLLLTFVFSQLWFFMVLLYHDGISDRVLLSCSVCCDFWPGVGRLSALTSLFFLFVTLDTTEEELIGCLVTPSGIFNSIFSLKASHVPHSLIMCVFSFFVSFRCVCKQSGVDAESDGARAQSGEFRALKGRGSKSQASAGWRTATEIISCQNLTKIPTNKN